MKELTIVVPNKIGALAEVADALGKNGINILSISAYGCGGQGIIRLITSDERSTLNVMTKYISTKKEGGYEVRMGDVIILLLPNRPGELAKVCKKIARAGINLESVYQIKSGEKTELIIKPERVEETMKLLREYSPRA